MTLSIPSMPVHAPNLPMQGGRLAQRAGVWPEERLDPQAAAATRQELHLQRLQMHMWAAGVLAGCVGASSGLLARTAPRRLLSRSEAAPALVARHCIAMLNATMSRTTQGQQSLSRIWTAEPNSMTWSHKCDTSTNHKPDLAVGSLAMQQGSVLNRRQCHTRPSPWAALPPCECFPSSFATMPAANTVSRALACCPPAPQLACLLVVKACVTVQAFDGKLSTKWLDFGAAKQAPAWLEYRCMPDQAPAVVTHYALVSADDEPSRDPCDFALEGYLDCPTSRGKIMGQCLAAIHIM